MIGYIFRLEENKVVVMTKDLDFHKIRRTNNMVCLGQEVAFSKSDIIKPSFFSKTNIIKFGTISSGIAAAILIIFFTFINPNIISNNKVYAFIDVDTNLSVRLKVNDHNKVLGIEPIDINSQTAIKDINLRSKTLSEALEIIVEKSKKNGLNLNESSEYIMISASINSDASISKKADTKKLDEILNSVNSKIEEMDNVKLSKRIIRVDVSTCELASANNVSMGRYVAYVKTKEKGLDITIDEARKNSLSVLLEKADYSLDTNQNNSNIVVSNDNQDINKTNSDNFNNEKKIAQPNDDENDEILDNKPNNEKSSNSEPISKRTNPKKSGSKRTNAPRTVNKQSHNSEFEFNTPMPKKIDTVADDHGVDKYHNNTTNVYNNTPQTFNTPVVLSTKSSDPSPTPIPYIAYYSEITHHTPEPKISTPNIIVPSIVTEDKKEHNTPSPKKDFVQSKIEILAYEAKNISSNSAIISGEVKSFANYNMPTSIVLIYWEARNPGYIYTAATRTQNSFPASISAEIKNLKPYTSYYYKVVVNSFFSSNTSYFKTQHVQITPSLTEPNDNNTSPTPYKKEPNSTPMPIPKYEYPPYNIYYPQPTPNKRTDHSYPKNVEYRPHKP